MRQTKTRIAIAAVVSVTACGGQATQSTEPPNGVSVSLHQWRSDEASHMIEVSVRNDTSTPVRFQDVQLVTDSFATLPPERVDTTLRKTLRTDLRIPYGEARCDPVQIPPVKPATVVAHVQVRDEPLRKALFPVPHPDPLLAQLVQAECGAFIVRQSADVTFGSDWTQVGKALRGILTVTRKTGGDQITIHDIGTTAHFNIRPISGKRRPVVVLPPGSTSAEVPVEVTPARCDPHAFADAKKAHLFPVWASVGSGETYWLIVALSEQTLAAFMSYARKTCGLA